MCRVGGGGVHYYVVSPYPVDAIGAQDGTVCVEPMAMMVLCTYIHSSSKISDIVHFAKRAGWAQLPEPGILSLSPPRTPYTTRHQSGFRQAFARLCRLVSLLSLGSFRCAVSTCRRPALIAIKVAGGRLSAIPGNFCEIYLWSRLRLGGCLFSVLSHLLCGMPYLGAEMPTVGSTPNNGAPFVGVCVVDVRVM